MGCRLWVERKASFSTHSPQPTVHSLEIWLGRKDSNLRMAGSKPAALPLGDAPKSLQFAPSFRTYPDVLSSRSRSGERFIPRTTYPRQRSGTRISASAARSCGMAAKTHDPVPVSLASP
jgi:hypothetical protein